MWLARLAMRVWRAATMLRRRAERQRRVLVTLDTARTVQRMVQKPLRGIVKLLT